MNDRNKSAQRKINSRKTTDAQRNEGDPQLGGWSGDEGLRQRDRDRPGQGQVQANEVPAQQGGLSEDRNDGRGRLPAADRDRDYDPDGDRSGRRR